MDSQGQDMMAAFQQLFTPAVQFPRWFQPNKDIGAIFVSSQEEEDELAARDWTPKPLPGSENPVAKIQSIEDVSTAMEALESAREMHAQQMVTDRAELDAKMARLEAMMQAVSTGSSAPGAAPTPPADGVSGTDMPGGLSDASDEIDENLPAAAPTPAAKSSKK